ncbi:MAG: AAA family ATPase [bacterium]|nr:AAA family ATPase [bacterium]
MNPYDWRGHRPQVEIIRPDLKRVAGALLSGGSGVLIAGRGLGKSVFLRQLRAELGRQDDVCTVLFETPPTELTVTSCVEELADKLGVTVAKPNNTYKVIEAYLKRPDAAGHVVLLYDEFDRYARSRISPADPPGRDFFNNLESMRRDFPEVGILAAGGIGVFAFRDDLGSSFLARAERLFLGPFAGKDLEELAQPFAEDDRPLSTDILASLLLATGGHPALTTYGLESLWLPASPAVHDLVDAFSLFKDRYSDFLRDFRLSFSSPSLSEVPQRVWDLIQSGDGLVSHEDLRQACAVPPDSILELDFADALDLLRAAGLVRVTGSVNTDPVDVRPIASILSLPKTSSRTRSLRDQLRQDLQLLLARLHVLAADFFRPGSEGEGKHLVPEMNLSAFLTLGFSLLGWQAEREAQHGAGRTDIKLRWPSSGERALVEVKIWPRKGYREAHRQLESYWSADILAGAVVMITDAKISDWPTLYHDSCLSPLGLTAERHPTEGSPIRAWFSCTSTTPDEIAVHVDHFLIRLPRGR